MIKDQKTMRSIPEESKANYVARCPREMQEQGARAKRPPGRQTASVVLQDARKKQRSCKSK
jgi:hypothetical protein